MRRLTVCLFATCLAVSQIAQAESVQGIYLEARSTSGSWSAASSPGENSLRQAVLIWQVQRGAYQGVDLAGRTILAIVTAEPSPRTSLGDTQTVFVVDEKANASQQEALVNLAKALAPEVIHQSRPVLRRKMDVRIGEGCARGHAVVDCELVKIRTRRPGESDLPGASAERATAPLGNIFYSYPAVTEEYSYAGSPALAVRELASSLTGGFSH